MLKAFPLRIAKDTGTGNNSRVEPEISRLIGDPNLKKNGSSIYPWSRKSPQ